MDFKDCIKPCLFLLAMLIIVAKIALSIIFFLVVNVIALDFIAITGIAAWYVHIHLAYTVSTSIFIGVAVAIIAILLTRIKYIGPVIMVIYSVICAYLFYLWLDDFWNCDSQMRKIITEIICSVIIIVWHFISLKNGSDLLLSNLPSFPNLFGKRKHREEQEKSDINLNEESNIDLDTDVNENIFEMKK